jgi:hypothetical protein
MRFAVPKLDRRGHEMAREARTYCTIAIVAAQLVYRRSLIPRRGFGLGLLSLP